MGVPGLRRGRDAAGGQQDRGRRLADDRRTAGPPKGADDGPVRSSCTGLGAGIHGQGRGDARRPARFPDNPWVITGSRAGERLANLNAQWVVVRMRAGLEDVRHCAILFNSVRRFGLSTTVGRMG